MASRSLLLSVLVTGLLGGCSALSLSPGKDEFLRIAREYNDGLRWGRADQALGRIAPELRSRMQERVTDLGEEIEILDYDLLAINMSPKGKAAQTRVSFSWMERSTMTVQRTVVAEEWAEKDHAWRVVKQERLRGAPLLLADEPKPRPVRAAPGTPAAPGAAPASEAAPATPGAAAAPATDAQAAPGMATPAASPAAASRTPATLGATTAVPAGPAPSENP